MAKKDLAKNAEERLPSKFDYSEDAADGFQNQTMEDCALPWLNLLQDLSPQIKKGEHNIDGAEQGMFCDTLSKEIFDGEQGLEIVIAATEHVFCEWKPKMGGFVGRRDIRDPEVVNARQTQTFGEYKSKAKNDLIETFYVYGVRASAEPGGEPVSFIMSITGTKIKTYKQFNQRLKMFQTGETGNRHRPPIYAHRVLLTSFPDRKGTNDFFNLKIAGAVGDDLEAGLLELGDVRYQAAKALCRSMFAGEAKVDYDAQQQGAGKKNDDEDTPDVF
jgi:hypothetical protein